MTIAFEVYYRECKKFCFTVLVTHLHLINRIIIRKRIMELFGIDSNQNNYKLFLTFLLCFLKKLFP